MDLRSLQGETQEDLGSARVKKEVEAVSVPASGPMRPWEKEIGSLVCLEELGELRMAPRCLRVLFVGQCL